MKSQYNNVVMVGNLGRDPDVRERMTSFSLAIYQGRDKPSMWLMVKCFDMRVDASKGQKVRVEGRLYFETYQAKDGTQKSVWGIVADTVEPVQREEKQQRPAYLPPLDEDCPF